MITLVTLLAAIRDEAQEVGRRHAGAGNPDQLPCPPVRRGRPALQGLPATARPAGLLQPRRRDPRRRRRQRHHRGLPLLPRRIARRPPTTQAGVSGIAVCGRDPAARLRLHHLGHRAEPVGDLRDPQRPWSGPEAVRPDPQPRLHASAPLQARTNSTTSTGGRSRISSRPAAKDKAIDAADFYRDFLMRNGSYVRPENTYLAFQDDELVKSLDPRSSPVSWRVG